MRHQDSGRPDFRDIPEIVQNGFIYQILLLDVLLNVFLVSVWIERLSHHTNTIKDTFAPLHP
jgi:hypothetical protein